MQKCNPLPLRTDTGNLIDEPNSRSAAASQNSFEIGHRKADVMNPRAAPSDEFSHRRRRVRRFQKLHQRFPRLKRLDPRAIRIRYRGRLQSQDFAIERQCLVKGR